MFSPPGSLVFIFIIWVKTHSESDIGKLLPYETAAQFTAYYYALTTLSLNLGYIVGGVVSLYLGYRIAFIVAAGIIFGRWIFVLIEIRKRQKPLVAKQMEFVAYYQSLKQQDLLVENECFPLCLEAMKNLEPGSNSNRTFVFWTEFALNLVQFGAMWGADLMHDQFLIPYMSESASFEDVPLLWVLSMMMVLNVVFVTMSFSVPSLIQGLGLLRQYMLAVPLEAYSLLLFFRLFPSVSRSQLYLYWINCIISFYSILFM